MGLGMGNQMAESLALQLHQIGLIHQSSGIHIAAAHHVGDHSCDVLVKLADKATVAHIHQRPLDGCLTTATRHREAALERRTPAAGGHGLGLIDRNEQHLVLVRHDDVAFQQVAELARLQRAGPHLGHGGCGEAFGQEGQQILAGAGGGIFGSAAGDIGQATGTGNQTHTNFHQADIAFHMGHAAGRVHGHFTAAAQRQPMDGRHHRHLCITQAQHQVLQLLLNAFNRISTANHKGGHGGFQISPHAERRVTRPDDHAVKVALSRIHGFHQAFHHFRADGMHLVLDAGDQHLAIQRPGAQCLGFGQRGTSGLPVGQIGFAQ